MVITSHKCYSSHNVTLTLDTLILFTFMPLSHLVGISRNQAEPAGIKVRARFWWEFQISKNAARLLRTNLE